MTGYEIKKRVGTALESVTNASYGTLYPTLHRLLDEGAVHMREYSQKRRPARKVYQITERGRHELSQWLRQPAGADQIRREFLLKLFLADELPPEELKTLVEQRRAETEHKLAELCRTQTHAAPNGSASTQQWVREYTVEMCKTELNWLQRLMDQLEASLDGNSEVHGI